MRIPTNKRVPEPDKAIRQFDDMGDKILAALEARDPITVERNLEMAELVVATSVHPDQKYSGALPRLEYLMQQAREYVKQKREERSPDKASLEETFQKNYRKELEDFENKAGLTGIDIQAAHKLYGDTVDALKVQQSANGEDKSTKRSFSIIKKTVKAPAQGRGKRRIPAGTKTEYEVVINLSQEDRARIWQRTGETVDRLYRTFESAEDAAKYAVMKASFPLDYSAPFAYWSADHNTYSSAIVLGESRPRNVLAWAASRALANALGDSNLETTIYRESFRDGTSPLPETITAEWIQQEYEKKLPRNESPLVDILGGGHGENEQRRKLLAKPEERATQLNRSGYGYSWPAWLEQMERTASGMRQALQGVRNRIQTAERIMGGPTKRTREVAEQFNDYEKTIAENLEYIRSKVREEEAENRKKMEPQVRADVEAYATWGPAAWNLAEGAEGREPATVRLYQFGVLSGWWTHPTDAAAGQSWPEASIWREAMQRLGIEPQPKPERLEMPTGKNKLIKAEIQALENADLAAGNLWAGTMDVQERLEQRGWVDPGTSQLTDLGKRAVYTMRITDAEERSGLPMDSYKPGTGRIADMGQTRFGNTENAWNLIDGEAWYTEGHGMWKGEFPKYWPPRDKSKPGPDMERVVPKSTGINVKPVGWAKTNNGRFVVFSNGSIMSGDLYDHTLSLGTVDQWTQEDPTKLFQAWRGGKRIALIMPMRNDSIPPALEPFVEKKRIEDGVTQEDTDRDVPKPDRAPGATYLGSGIGALQELYERWAARRRKPADMSGPVSKKQIRKIRTVRRKLGLPDDTYRELIAIMQTYGGRK